MTPQQWLEHVDSIVAKDKRIAELVAEVTVHNQMWEDTAAKDKRIAELEEMHRGSVAECRSLHERIAELRSTLTSPSRLEKPPGNNTSASPNWRRRRLCSPSNSPPSRKATTSARSASRNWRRDKSQTKTLRH